MLAPDKGRAPLSSARHHGDFDDDPDTVRSTFARILEAKPAQLGAISFGRSASSLREQRRQLELKSR